MDNDRIRQLMAEIQQVNNNVPSLTDAPNYFPSQREIDIMRANNNAGGSVGNVSNTEQEMFNAAEIAALRAQGASGNGILSNEEKARFMQLRNQQEQMKMNNTAPQDINSILKLINSPQQVEKTYQFPNNPNTYTEEELAIIRYMQDKEM